MGVRASTAAPSRHAGGLRRFRPGSFRLVPRDENLAFGLRLLLSFGVTLVLVGIVGYVLIVRELRSSQVGRYAQEQQADVRVFEAKSREVATEDEAIASVAAVIEAIAQRPGTLEALLVDRRGVVVAAGAGGRVGRRDVDERIDAALRRGERYAGHEGDPDLDAANFEFVIPVELPSGRYAYEVSFDHGTFDEQLTDLRRILVLIEALTLLGGARHLLPGRREDAHARPPTRARACTPRRLTGLPNRRAFHDELERAVRGRARGRPLAPAVLDLDDVEPANDRHGHLYGDELLRRAANVLCEWPGVSVYRIGGDEFAVFAETDATGAAMIASRLVRAMGDAGIRVSAGSSNLRTGPAGGGAARRRRRRALRREAPWRRPAPPTRPCRRRPERTHTSGRVLAFAADSQDWEVAGARDLC